MAVLLQFTHEAGEATLTNVVRLPAQRDGAGFYTPREAARISQVPRHRLDAWRREQIVSPGVTYGLSGETEDGYTFETLIYLRLLRLLREDHKLSLVRSVQTVKSIRERFGGPGPAWAELRILRQGGHVMLYRNDTWELTVGSSSGPPVQRHQRAFPKVLMGEEFTLMKERADALLIPSQYLRYVEIDPSARNGMPIIRKTTITTGLIFALRKQGWTPRSIKESYPSLTLEQIRAAINYETFLDNQSLAA